jgi:integrase
MSRDNYGSGSLSRRGRIWWLQYRVDGETVRESAKTTKKAEAQLMLQRALGQKHRGELPTQVKRKSGLTCGEVMQDYVDGRKGKAVYRTYKGQLEHHLLPFFGTIPVTKLTGEDILEYRKLRAGQRVASNAHSALPETKLKTLDYVTETSINRELAVLRGALKEKMKLDPDAVPRIPYFKMASESDNVRHGFLDEKKLAGLLAALPVYLRCLVACAFYCGGRMSEWLRLDWEDIDLDTRLIYFRKTKTKHPREVPIWAGTLMEKLILAQHQGRELTSIDAVFTYDGMNRLSAFRKSWERAVSEAGFSGLRFHDMRRSANRWMRDRRVPQPIRMYIMGHRTASMDIRYGIVDRVSLDAARDAVKAHATNLAAH